MMKFDGTEYYGFKAQLTTVSIQYDVNDDRVFACVITYVLVKHDVIRHTGMPMKDGIALVQMRSFSKTEHDKVMRCAKELVNYQKGAVLIGDENYYY